MFDSNLHIKLVKQIILTFFLAALIFPQFGAAQNLEIVAKKGDGIYKLLTENGLSYSKNLDSFIDLNKGKIGKDNSLFVGTKYKIPTGGESTEKITTAKSVKNC